MKNDNKIIDITKLFFSICIVLIHSGFFWNFKYGFFAIQLILRLAVPFFFIISGYFYSLDVKSNQNGDSLKKFIKRLLKIYIPWSLIYILFDFVVNNNYSEYYLISEIIKILSGNVGSVLWYIGSLIISLFIISIIKSKKGLKKLYLLSLVLYFIGLTFTTYHFLFINIIPNWQNAFIKIFLNNRNFIFVGIIYTLTGYYLNNIINKFCNKKLFIILLLSFITMFIEAFIIYNHLNVLSEYDYLISYLIFVPTLVILLIKLDKFLKIKFDTRFVRNLSTTIYLIHFLVIKIIDYFIKKYGKTFILLQNRNILYGIICVMITILLSFILNKIKNKKIRQFIC